MSERFNFYDVYGYLIPGFALLGLLWLPVGIASGKAPNLGLSEALGWLLIAYVVGHILSGVADHAFPSGRRVARHEFRHPSDDMLDDTLYPKRATLNAQVRKKVGEEYGLQLAQGPQERELHDLVFRLCRDRLVAEGKGAYVEQFHGMYSMMRGISAASIVTAYYLLGWVVSGNYLSPEQTRGAAGNLPMSIALIGLFVGGLDYWLNPPRNAPKPQPVTAPAMNGGATGKGLSTRARVRKYLLKWWPGTLFSLCVAAAALAGFFVGRTHSALSSHPSLVVALAASSVFLAGRCYNAFQFFAYTFADTVYHNFLALPKNVKL